MKKYSLIFTIFSLISALTVCGQDIHFSQYNLTPLVVNPAQAGAYKSVQVIANYKSQWTSVSPNAYKTMMLSYDGRFMQKKWQSKWLAGGINIFSDKAGDGNMKTMQGNITFGYHSQISDRSTLGACLVGGFAQRSIDYSKLTWDEQYVNGAFDPNAQTFEQAGSVKFGYSDFGLGVLYQYNKGQMYSSANDMFILHTGLAITHLNRPQYSFYSTSDERLYAKITAHADALIGIKNTNFSLLPGFIYRSQGPASEVLPGCYFRYMLSEQSKFTGFIKGASIMLGTHWRVKDAFIPSVQFELAEYAIGLSYDMNMSGLRSATSGKGGFEISLRYGTPNPFLYKSQASFQ
jgi:type IX secretion system PorP/SprF family membrane protein